MTKSRDLGNLAQTVAVNLPTSLGTAGQTLAVNSGENGLEFADASSGSGVTVYTGLSGTDGTPANATYLLNASSPSAGDLAYVSSNTSLYQNNGNGWYRIAVINTTPTISSVADASSNTTPFTLEGGTNTVITVTASDADEGTDLIYDHSVTSGSLNGTTVTQGTGANENVFTIVPHSSNATAFSITFSVSDSINAATSVAEFTLQFIIDDSHYTTLLMATDGSVGDNNNDIADATGNHTSNITVSDSPSAGTFSPYRHGGYSAYMGGNGNYISTPHATSLKPSGADDFCVSLWYWPNATPSTNTQVAGDFRVASWPSTCYGWDLLHLTSNVLAVRWATPAYKDMTSGSTTLNIGEWSHIVYCKNDSTMSLYINGTRVNTTTSDIGMTATDLSSFYIGWAGSSSGSTEHSINGYITDFKLDIGGNNAFDATATSITVPTERATGGNNTKLFACHLPYLKDGSTSPHTLSFTGSSTGIKPIGPYDHEQYSESTNGGSIEFDGSNDDLTITDSTDFDLSTGNWTVEFWWNPKSVNTNEGPMSVGYASGNTPAGLKFAWESNRLYLFAGLGNGSVLTSLYLDATAASLVNRWNHIAAVYDGTNTDLFLNGTSSGRAQNSNYGAYDGSADLRVGSVNRISAIHYSECSITDVRIVKGTAVYSGAFTPPTGPLTATGGTYSSTTNVNTSITSGHTKLLISGTDGHVLDKSQGNNLKLIGTTAAVTSSSSPTPPNNTTISSQNSIFFDGNSDYITISDNELFGWGTGSWTFEVWLYITKTGGFNAIFDTRVGTGTETGSFGLGVHTTGRVQMYSGADSPAQFYYPTDTLSFNTWQHFAIVKNASTNVTTMYFNGTAASTTYSDTRNYGASQPIQIGKDDTTSNYFGGYMQDLRITKGLARTISVPSAPLKG